METIKLKIDRSMRTYKTIPIKPGSSDSNVLIAKKILNSVGYLLTETNQFDVAMQRAIKDFQKKSGLDVDGILGKDTANRLNQVAQGKVLISQPVTTTTTIKKPSSLLTTKPSHIPPEAMGQETKFNWMPWAIIAIAVGFFLFKDKNR